MSTEQPNVSERNETTLGVVVERISNIDVNVRRIENNLSKLESKIDGHYATKEEVSTIKLDVAELKDNRKWLVTTILGAIILAILAGIGLNQR